jgi:hypothetical protein
MPQAFSVMISMVMALKNSSLAGQTENWMHAMIDLEKWFSKTISIIQLRVWLKVCNLSVVPESRVVTSTNCRQNSINEKCWHSTRQWF